MSQGVERVTRQQFLGSLGEQFPLGLCSQLPLASLHFLAFDAAVWVERLCNAINFFIRDRLTPLFHLGLTHAEPNPVDDRVDRIRSPRIPAAASEDSTGGILKHELASDLHGLVGKVDDPRHGLALGLGAGKHPSLMIHVHMPAFEPQALLGTAADFVRCSEKVTEVGILQVLQDLSKFVGRHVDLLAVGGG